MDLYCKECETEHSIGDMEPSAILPSAAAELGEAEKQKRLRAWDNLAVLDGERYFVRGVLPLPVAGERIPFNIGIWTEVGPDEFRRYQAAGDRTRIKPISGKLANALPLLGRTLGIPVQLEVHDPELVPNVRVLDEASRVGALQSEGMLHEEVLELMHAYFGHRASGKPVQSADAAASLEQAHRHTSTRRLLDDSERHLGATVRRPGKDFVYTSRIGVLGPIEGGSAGQFEFLSGDVAEEIVARAESRMEEVAPIEARWGFSVWNLDRESPEFSRIYDPRGFIEDDGPMPALIPMAAYLARPYGEISFVETEPGVFDPALCILMPTSAYELPQFEAAIRALDPLRHTVAGDRVLGSAGKMIGWITAGTPALHTLRSIRTALESWRDPQRAAETLGLPAKRAGELIELRLQQIEILFEALVQYAQATQGEAEPSSETAGNAREAGRRLDGMNRRAGAKGELTKLVRLLAKENEDE